MSKKTVAVIGDGAWGTALALVAAENGHCVKVWGAFPEYVAEVAKSRENSKFLPGIKLPDALVYAAEFSEAVGDADLVLNATPTQFVRTVFEENASLVQTSESAEEIVQRRQNIAYLGQLLAQLSPRERELIALKYGAGLTNRKIAALTSFTESNVGTIIHRAVKKLREQWEE